MGGKTKSIDWINHGLEFIVVILGILLAFQLNKCSIEKTQLETTKSHLDQIREETEINKHFLQSSIEQSNTNITKLDSVLQLIELQEDFTTINRFALELLNIGTVYIRKSAYLSLTKTGDLKLIKDFKQKQNVVNLYEYYTWVESFNEISVKLYTDDYYPYLKNNFDLVGGSVQDEDIYTAKVFKNILGAYYRTNKNRLQKYEDCMKEIDDYLQNIE